MTKDKVWWRDGLSTIPKYWLMDAHPDAEVPELLQELDGQLFLSTERPATIYCGFDCPDDFDQDGLMDWARERGFHGVGFYMGSNEYDLDRVGSVVIPFAWLEEPVDLSDEKQSKKSYEAAKWFYNCCKAIDEMELNDDDF